MWSRIVGHQQLIQSFQGLVQRGRMAHAYLFVGRSGVGKSLFAHELGKALLCDKSTPAHLEACDACTSCTLFRAGTHPDFFVVRRPDDTQELKIDLLRELCQKFGLKPMRGHGKVAILEDADDLNDESANCFLKTLEEPPPHSLFILIGTSPDRQLPTILSRSHIVRFASLSESDVERVLGQQGVEANELSRLVKASRGSPGQALALSDMSLWDGRRRLLQNLAQPRIDVIAISKTFLTMVEEAGKESSLQRRRAILLLDLLLAAWSDALRITVGDSNVDAGSDELAALHFIADRAGPERIMELIERGIAAERQIGFYIQIGLVLEGLVEAWARILEENPAPTLISSKK